MLLEAGKPKVKIPADSVSAEGPLQMAVLHLYFALMGSPPPGAPN